MNNTNGQQGYSTATPPEVITTVRKRLEELKQQHDLEPLKQLFRIDLNYSYDDSELSTRDWSQALRDTLNESPLLFARGGKDNDFDIVYIHLKDNELLLTHERPIVLKLLDEHLDALFIFSNASQSKWHFVNVKQDTAKAKRRLFRRITIGPEERLRTASERLALLDLAKKEEASSIEIRDLHEKAFDVEAVTKGFFEQYKILRYFL